MAQFDQRGVSLVEVSVASALMLAVVALVLPMMATSFTTLGQQESRAQTTDQGMLALRQIERDVRSGNVIRAPGAVDGVAGMEVRIYTQTRGAPFQCVQYRVTDGSLQRRTRPPGALDEHPWPTGWSEVADGVTNATQAPAAPAFSRSVDRQTLSVLLVMNRAERPEAAVRLNSSITGRNTKYYDTPFAEDQCD